MVKRRALFKGQIVCRKMRRVKFHRRVKVRFQFMQRLTRIGVNQIKAEIVESGPAHDCERVARFIGGMNAAEKLEQRV